MKRFAFILALVALSFSALAQPAGRGRIRDFGIEPGIFKPGTYNAVTRDGQVLVMSHKLENFNAKYCCMTKLDAVSTRLLKGEIDNMINNNMYDQFFEDSLVQLIMFHDFQLFSEDIAGKTWAEVDTVDDLLNAQQIHFFSKLNDR